jgi:hypothetical protein
VEEEGVERRNGGRKKGENKADQEVNLSYLFQVAFDTRCCHLLPPT